MRLRCRAGSGARTTAAPTSALGADSGRRPVSCVASLCGCGQPASGQAGWPQPARISQPSRNKGRRGLRDGCSWRAARGAGNFSAFGTPPHHQAETGVSCCTLHPSILIPKMVAGFQDGEAVLPRKCAPVRSTSTLAIGAKKNPESGWRTPSYRATTIITRSQTRSTTLQSEGIAVRTLRFRVPGLRPCSVQSASGKNSMRSADEVSRPDSLSRLRALASSVMCGCRAK